MRDTSTKFPNRIDSRTFFSDIDLSQVPIMKNYYTLQNAGNYTRASKLLNNSEVFFYGAWWLNMMENRLHTIGEYLIGLEEKPHLTTYCDLLPKDSEHEEINWVGDEDIIEFRDDYVETVNTNIYIGDDIPSNPSIFDTWIENGENSSTAIEKESINCMYQNDEPNVNEKYDIWIGNN